jgi:4-amino-4-deoxy-L-arabinose transferase-like glycosyltransferase
MNTSSSRAAFLAGLLGCLAAALAVRLVMLVVRLIIMPDGVFYLAWAEQVASGDWSAAFNATVFNLYPVLVAGTHALLSLFGNISYEAAALSLNMVCGVVLVYPLYVLAYRYFGLVAACITGVFTAFCPLLALTSAEVLRESPFLALVAWALDLYITALDGRPPRQWGLLRLAVAGALLFVAGLIRIEGFGVLAILGAGLLIVHARRPWAFFARGRAALALVALVIALAIPAAAYVHARTGQWHFARLDKITASWSLGEMDTRARDPLAVTKDLVIGPDGKIDTDALYRVNFLSLAKRYRQVLFTWECLDAAFKAFHGLGVLLLAGGLLYLIVRRPLRLDDPLIVVIVLSALVFLPVYYRYAATKFYLSSRHVLLLVLPTAVIMGAWWRAVPERIRARRLLWLAVAAIGIVVIAAETYRPRGASKVVLRRCGELLADELPTNAVVMVTPGMRVMSFYARHRSADLHPGAAERVRQFISKPQRYLVLDLSEDWQRAYTNLLADVMAPAATELPQSSRYRLVLFTRAPIE